MISPVSQNGGKKTKLGGIQLERFRYTEPMHLSIAA